MYEIIKNNPLFAAIKQTEFDTLFDCLNISIRHYKKDTAIFFTGERVTFIGLIISGSIKICKEDYNGNHLILTKLGATELFGETIACAGLAQSPVTVYATEDTDIACIDFNKIITTCGFACPFHTRLIENMIVLQAKKNVLLNQKIEILSKKTTREKILSLLSFYRSSSKKIVLPYTREEMAHYLCIDRSALSNELSKMQSEGILLYKKNIFEIYF